MLTYLVLFQYLRQTDRKLEHIWSSQIYLQADLAMDEFRYLTSTQIISAFYYFAARVTAAKGFLFATVISNHEISLLAKLLIFEP